MSGGLPSVTRQLIAEAEQKAAAPAEVPSAPKLERPAWRAAPLHSPEWLDQLLRHLAATQWPAVEIVLQHRTVGGSEEAWREYIQELVALPGYQINLRQQIERRVMYAEACQVAEQNGEDFPADPDEPAQVGKMWASPERENLE